MNRAGQYKTPLEQVTFEGGTLDGERRRWRAVWSGFKQATQIYVPGIGHSYLWEYYERVSQGPGKAIAKLAREISERPEREFNPGGWPRGRARTHLTPDDIRAIRASPLSLTDVAIEHRISKSTAHDIRTRKTWGHIE